jgi:hypothetical protein
LPRLAWRRITAINTQLRSRETRLDTRQTACVASRYFATTTGIAAVMTHRFSRCRTD